MLCFAYGSNMDWDQMRERCPSTRFVGTAVLRDHRLAFTRKSTNRNCGVADGVPEHGRELWGVVYEICDHDVGKLDTAEGYRPGREKNSYWRRECLVFLDNDGERPLTVSTYFAEREPNPPLPNAEYKNLILSGARYWHLPEGYIRELEEIRVST
jgi:gamma-glutamylcyclotransferase (GGCT)/AIG2-like uncharacterized protein YtfP